MSLLELKRISASTLSKLDYCEQSLFISKILGFAEPSGQKALKGTIVHKILELLAKGQLSVNKGVYEINDEETIGKFTFDKSEWFKSEYLSQAQVDYINTFRKNKSVYKHDCYLAPNSVRTGTKIINDLISLCYTYYSNKHTEFEWSNKDCTDISTWTWLSLESGYDPRIKQIVSTEKKFEIPLEFEWAKLSDGSQLLLTGIIDLVLHAGDDIYEIVDWKTGQRLNWATGKEKTYTDLQKDEQLMLYYYAARTLFKDAKDVIMTIVFIRDGGPFSICFDDSTMPKIERIIKQKFEKIKGWTVPKLLDPRQKSFKCNKLCPFYKSQLEDNNTCMTIHNSIKKIGIEATINKYKKEK